MLLEGITAVSMGTLFGSVTVRSGVFSASVIQDQFLMKDFTMCKMFFSAIGTSAAAFAGLSLACPAAFERSVAFFREDFVATVGAAAIGGSILGLGMAASASCPGTVYAQLGAGVPTAIFTFMGCIAGAIVFRALPQLKRLRGKQSVIQLGSQSLSPTLISGLVAVCCTAAALALEVMMPSAVSMTAVAGLFDRSAPLNPLLAGVVVGLLQIPAVLIFSAVLGSSTSYTNIITGNVTHWQTAYTMGIIGGAYLSRSSMTEAPGSEALNVAGGPLMAFLGGVLATLGANISNGCTSGHGISGMSLGSVQSLVAVAGMFAAGIASLHIAALLSK
jgi:uncharacterized membrane protein YedE/YeeE